MKRNRLISTVIAAGMALSLSACQQRQEEASEPAARAPDVNITTPAPETPPANVNVTPPDVNINPPDVNINPPDVTVRDQPPATSRESTTVTVPGVGSTTTTVEKK